MCLKALKKEGGEKKLRKQSEKDFEALTSSIHFLAYPGWRETYVSCYYWRGGGERKVILSAIIQEGPSTFAQIHARARARSTPLTTYLADVLC